LTKKSENWLGVSFWILTSTSIIKICHNHVEKTLPQPLLQPDKPKTTTQTKNKPQKTTRKNASAHRTPSTTKPKEKNSSLPQINRIPKQSLRADWLFAF